jgi:hypothetical protein
MHKEAREELRVRLKLIVLVLAPDLGVTKACQEFNMPRTSFSRWKQKYEKEGRSGLYRERPIAYRYPRRTSLEVVEKILAIRTEHQIRALRIMYYLDRYQACSAHPTVCKNGSQTPRTGRCEVLTPERSRGKAGETISIHRDR